MKLDKTRFKCNKCKSNLQKVTFENLYYCLGCGSRFTLPYDKARKENRRKQRESGILFNKAVIRDGVIWHR